MTSHIPFCVFVLLMSLCAAQAAVLPGQPFTGIEDLCKRVSVNDLVKLKDGRMFMAFGPGSMGAYSNDGGKTWGEAFPILDKSGNPVSMSLGSLLESKPGALGYYWQSPAYVIWWRRSTDSGKTWSDPISINKISGAPVMPHVSPRPFEECLSNEVYYAADDRGIVLKTGRIVIPFAVTLTGPLSDEPGAPQGWDTEETMCGSFAYYSDDDGLTWTRSRQFIMILLDGRYPADHKKYMTEKGKGGFFQFEEPTAAELSNGDVMMLGRSTLGRSFASYSQDAGVNWRQPKPLPLASPEAPSDLKKMPNGDMLVIWNQCSPEENVLGYSRHRLSTAVSSDDGKAWKHFRNLESLDDVAYIKPPDMKDIHSAYGPHYNQPKDKKRYRHAPGSVRSCYPNARVLEDYVIVEYNYGSPTPETPDLKVTSKRRVLPIGWFYGK